VRATAEGFGSGTTSVECRAGERAVAEVVLQALTAPNEGSER
jgi:hypothetical protein